MFHLSALMNIMDENLKRKKNLSIRFVEDKKKKIMGCIRSIGLDMKDSVPHRKLAECRTSASPWPGSERGPATDGGSKGQAGVGFV